MNKVKVQDINLILTRMINKNPSFIVKMFLIVMDIKNRFILKKSREINNFIKKVQTINDILEIQKVR